MEKNAETPDVDEARPAGPAATPPPSASAKKTAVPSLPSGGYGIAQAIDLMRSLPVATNMELVVQVIKKTLESANVRVAVIIEDATNNQQAIDARMKTLRGEISSLETEIAKRSNEIDRLETSLAEITRVKEHLALAERLTVDPTKTDPARVSSAAAKPPPAPPAGAKPTAGSDGDAPPAKPEGKPDRPRSIPPR